MGDVADSPKVCTEHSAWADLTGAGDWCKSLEVSTEYVFNKNDSFSAFKADKHKRRVTGNNYDLEKESSCEKCKACVVQ